MRKVLFFLVLFQISLLSAIIAQPAKTISDCTVVYEVSIEGANSDAGFLKSMQGATKTVYIRGSKSRSELVSPSYSLVVMNDSKSDTTIVLKELGAAKYLSYLSEEKRQAQNRKYEGITFTPTTEKKAILGYECIKVIAKLKSGATFNVFYTNSIVPSNREYEYQFKELPGLVLEYETQTEEGKAIIRYTANKITLNPVPASKFEIPKSGYRIL